MVNIVLHIATTILNFLVPVAHAEAASGAASGSVTQLFGLDWKIFLAQLVNFAVVVFVLWKWAFKPLGEKLEQRRENIQRSLEKSKEIDELHAEAARMRLAQIEKARQEATGIIDNAQKAATQAKQEILDEAKAQSAKLLEQGKRMIQEEKQKMLAEVREEAATLVVMATEKILREKIDPKKDERLIKESLQKI